MRLLHKRILVLFSVALNIGFVIAALTMLIQHPGSPEDRSWKRIMEVMDRLDLPSSQSKQALGSMWKFRGQLDAIDEDLHRSREAVIDLLAREGPVDSGELQRLVEEVDRAGQRKSQMFVAHVLDLRKILGDEKGARFFALLPRPDGSGHGRYWDDEDHGKHVHEKKD